MMAQLLLSVVELELFCSHKICRVLANVFRSPRAVRIQCVAVRVN